MRQGHLESHPRPVFISPPALPAQLPDKRRLRAGPAPNSGANMPHRSPPPAADLSPCTQGYVIRLSLPGHAGSAWSCPRASWLDALAAAIAFAAPEKRAPFLRVLGSVCLSWSSAPVLLVPVNTDGSVLQSSLWASLSPLPAEPHTHRRWPQQGAEWP